MTARADLGPFDPPVDYAFEPELLLPVPRPIPRSTWHAHLQREWTWTTIGFEVVLGAWFFFALRGMEPWLGKSTPWLGVALIAFSALGISLGRLRQGPARYIRYGVPLVGRVVGLDTTPTLLVDGQPLYYAITALIEHRDPQTGEVRSQQVKSPEFAAGKKDDYTTTFQVGDYVTAVYLPGEYLESLQIFEFLELGPNLGFVRRGWEQ